MTNLYITFREEPLTHGKGVRGEQVGAPVHDDNTSSAVATAAIPGNADLVEFYSPDADHFVCIGSTSCSTNDARHPIPAGTIYEEEIPTRFRSTEFFISYCTRST